MGRRGIRAGAVATLAVLALLPSTAAAQSSPPAWKLEVSSAPTILVPGTNVASAIPVVAVRATNIGAGIATGSIAIAATLPAGLDPGLEASRGSWSNRDGEAVLNCSTVLRTVTCARASIRVPPGGTVQLSVPVAVEDLQAPSAVTVEGAIEGGGAAAVSASRDFEISSAEPGFGFSGGGTEPKAAFSSDDGSVFTQAGGHPYLLTIGAGINTVESRAGLRGAGGDLRDLEFELPPGAVVDPSGPDERCTQIELEIGSCPLASQIGLVQIDAVPDGAGMFSTAPTGLFAMVPSPGVASDLAFEFPSGFVFHLLGGVRSGDPRSGGYTFVARSESLPSGSPIVGIQVQFWGDPTSESLDFTRGGPGTACRPGEEGVPCAVEREQTALLTTPTSCLGPMSIASRIDSWQEPGLFVTSDGYFQDPYGTPMGTNGCGALPFTPTLEARPAGAVADSPTGFDAEVSIPREEELGSLAQPDLKHLSVMLPEGLSLDPSAANGLGACTPAQIGIDPTTDRPNQAQPTCPDASKVGTLEVETPLLDHTLPGQVYLATPRENPFDALLALYAVVNDPVSGTLIKMPLRVDAEEQTGRLEVSLATAPQLPFTHLRMHLYGGAGALLRTPARCGRYRTTSTAAPWSGNPATQLSDEYEISLPPGGGPCPTTLGSEPNSPSLVAGMASPVAGAFSPLTVDLSREDGTQEFSAISLAGPPGLSGRLAGVPRCSDLALSSAASESGRQEEENPSCPSGSLIGTVAVAAGAGPRPYWVTGHVYLTGPYGDAPLGAVAIIPAVAGPLDLGTVVVRSGISIDPTTGRLGLDSVQIPRILHGVPLDIREIRIRVDRPEFTRSGTSCSPSSITARVVSVFGQAKSLSDRFQLGECGALRFKPDVRISLKGALARNGHPSLRAIVDAREGEAGIEDASFALPSADLLDLRHLRSLCPQKVTVGQCPRGSQLGTLRLESPSFEGPLEGPVFLRAPDRRLPGVSAELRSGGLDLLLGGKIIQAEGHLAISLESLPDIPFSRAVLDLAGGRRGILVNSRALCGKRSYVGASLRAHNGKLREQKVRVQVKGCR
jgi:hypothetical protein